jgi:beta-glucosidase
MTSNSVTTRPAPALEAAAWPAEFRFGVSTAAYQIEGAAREDGRGESIWDTFSRVPGAMVGGDTGDVACDHYHRWREDLDLMRALRVESYRFSISWSRVLPAGAGAVNQAGLDFYRRLVEALAERDIEPIATLYHWDLPQALQDRGGWSSRDTAERFAEYAALMFGALGDVVPGWITHNEPRVVAFEGHADGAKAPGVRDWYTALRVTHHLNLSHGLALRAYREAGLDGRIGISMDPAPVYAASDLPEDLAAAIRWDGFHNRWFLDPVLRGRYPDDVLALYERRYGPFDVVRDGDLALASAPIDFLGVNYYSPERVRADPSFGPIGARRLPPPGPATAMGWEVHPQGLRELLGRIRRDYGPLPLYVTENGACYDDPEPSDGVIEDDERVTFLREHLAAIQLAIADGADVRRYCLWSLLDNLEWEHGYAKRFGIVHVDFATQRRTPKRSALWYRDRIAEARS